MEFCGILWNFFLGEKVEVEFLKFHKIPQKCRASYCFILFGLFDNLYFFSEGAR